MYQGNSPCHVRTAAEFLARYRGHLYVQSRQEQLRPLTADDMLKHCTTSAATAAGWDQWEAADWRHLSRKAAQALADLLNCIENGAPWPEPARWGKAHFLSKTDLPTLDPLDNRVLLVLQRLYRRWASIRLKQLEAWTQKWQHPAMFAGTNAVWARPEAARVSRAAWSGWASAGRTRRGCDVQARGSAA